MCAFITSLYCCCCFKDARSVSLYPYDWSQILLSILNKLTLQKKVQNFGTNNVFLDQKSKKKTTAQLKIKHKKPLLEPGIDPRTSCAQSRCVTPAPPSQLRVTIVVKLFNCFNTMGRNANKQNRICGPHIFNKFIFSVIFLHACITFLAVSYIYGSRFYCLNMVKI